MFHLDHHKPLCHVMWLKSATLLEFQSLADECGDAGTFIADSLIVDNIHEGPGAVDGNLKPISILTYSVVVAR